MIQAKDQSENRKIKSFDVIACGDYPFRLIWKLNRLCTYFLFRLHFQSNGWKREKVYQAIPAKEKKWFRMRACLRACVSKFICDRLNLHLFHDQESLESQKSAPFRWLWIGKKSLDNHCAPPVISKIAFYCSATIKFNSQNKIDYEDNEDDFDERWWKSFFFCCNQIKSWATHVFIFQR